MNDGRKGDRLANDVRRRVAHFIDRHRGKVVSQEAVLSKSERALAVRQRVHGFILGSEVHPPH